MKAIKLIIPKRNTNPAVTINPNAEQTRALLDELPLANPDACCTLLFQELFRLNRAPLAVKARIKTMSLILPMIDDMGATLRSTYINASLPLNKKRTQTSQLIDRLHTEMGYAYKLIALDLIEEERVSGAQSQELPQAIYNAIGFLSRQQVDCYALYNPEPKQIWLELNQLYLYAERNQLHNLELAPINPKQDPRPATILNSYRRIVMLTVANPYHLMQGEAAKMYEKLIDWAPACQVINLGANTLPEGKLFVDLMMDAPPLYAPKTQTQIRPQEGRLLEIKDMLAIIEKETRHLTIAKQRDQLNHSLTKRMERDMYFRWAEAWGIRRERLSNRKPISAPAHIICGLTATHHFMNDQLPFHPEEEELDIRGRDASLDPENSLRLIPEEQAPWAFEDQKKHIVSHVHQPRKSQFDPNEAERDRNMWVKVYANSTQTFDNLTGHASTDYEYHGCEIINVNQGGFGMSCPLETNFPARVGELIGSRTTDHTAWSIGMISWMKIKNSNGISLGIKFISEDAKPIAVKAIQGIGTGGEYYRALLIPDLDPAINPTTMLTPAAVYDIGSVLMLTMENRILYAQLIRQLTSTSAFSQYQFKLIQEPRKERELSQNQEDRISSRMMR
ncbi:hypothetical protein ACFL2V_05895 [Pseudomonadota bacterium]